MVARSRRYAHGIGAHPGAMEQSGGATGHLDRRQFLRGSALMVGAIAAAPLLPSAAVADFVAPRAAAAAENWWLGAALWANRTQDWAMRGGKITCLAAGGKQLLCTASVLTRSLDGRAATLKVVTGTQTAGSGFSGFLVGTGEPGGDYRRTALVHAFSGTGGGLLAVLGDDGVASFREHTDEVNQTVFSDVPSTPSGPRPPRRLDERVTLQLDITPTEAGRVSLTLQAFDSTGALQAKAVLADAAASVVAGGIALVSSGQGLNGGTYWFTSPQVTGIGAIAHPERAMGRIIGTLFSLSGGTLKMTAQLAPFSVQASDRVSLESRVPGGVWTLRATSLVDPGFTALLRVEDWDMTRATAYRVIHNRGGIWTGRVPAEPASGTALRIVTVSCSKAGHRGYDRRTPLNGGLADGNPLPLYHKENCYFPYESTFDAVATQRPNLLVAMGDQYYDGAPTKTEPDSAPDMDFYYRYIQWLWSVRELTRSIPTLVLIDDHDVYQGNLWGEGGVPVDPAGEQGGGYDRAPEWINLVQRVQCGHNPDPFDPAPVAQGIAVYFTRFEYGGVSFALLEDRKFKTSPDGSPGLPVADWDLLGSRQEAMLASLAGGTKPVVVLTQSIWASVLTNVEGAITGTKDTGGFPKPARDRALDLVKAARGVLLCGDSHLATLVRHGTTADQGPVQFGGPAVGSSYTRWFQPAEPLPDPNGQPWTGQARDALGNDFRVLAVANPRITSEESFTRGGDPNIGDRTLRQEGYGVLVVDKVRRTYRFESWENGVDPAAPGAMQMPGWPYTMSFDDA